MKLAATSVPVLIRILYRPHGCADFQVCCLAGFQTRLPFAKLTRSGYSQSADLVIGATAGLATRATPGLPASARATEKPLGLSRSFHVRRGGLAQAERAMRCFLSGVNQAKALP